MNTTSLTPIERAMVADVRRVARSLGIKPGAFFKITAYHANGGSYGNNAIAIFGGWKMLLEVAGIRERRTRWAGWRPPGKKTRGPIAAPMSLKPSGGLKTGPGGRQKRGEWGQGWQVASEDPVLERGEIITDMRRVSGSLGLRSASLLTFAIYHAHGGRFTYSQVTNFGGFKSLLRAA